MLVVAHPLLGRPAAAGPQGVPLSRGDSLDETPPPAVGPLRQRYAALALAAVVTGLEEAQVHTVGVAGVDRDVGTSRAEGDPGPGRQVAGGVGVARTRGHRHGDSS